MASPLVLLHGFTQTRQSWRRTVSHLQGSPTDPRGAAEGRGPREVAEGTPRVLAPDLPGHGLAAHRPASFPAVIAYVRALADGRFALGGYSMGGRIALATALALGDNQVERLILIGASPGIADDAERAARKAADDTLADRIEHIGVEAFAAEWAAQPLFAGQPENVAAAAHADRLRNTPEGLAAALRGLGTGVMEPLWHRLPELAMPVTLLAGERDEKFRAIAARMAERIPRAEIHVVPRAGHAAQLERPDVVARYLGSAPRHR